MPDPPRDIGPIPDGRAGGVHPDRDDPVAESNSTETEPAPDKDLKETRLPETAKTQEPKPGDAIQGAGTKPPKEQPGKTPQVAAPKTPKTPEAKPGATPPADTKTQSGGGASKPAGADQQPTDKKSGQDTKGAEPPIPPRRPPPGWPTIDCLQPTDELEKKLTQCMTTLYGETLVQDVEGSQMLLSFVTRNGLQEDKKVDDKVVQKLVATWQRMRAGTFDPETEEVDFRKSYGVIAKAADPVNVVSLRESTDKAWRIPWLMPWRRVMHSTAGNACLEYRNLAFLVLVALLICQIYWTILSSVLNKTDALSKEINNAPTNAEYDQLEVANQKASTVANQPETNKPGPPSTAPSASPTAPPKLPFVERNEKTAERDANYRTLKGLVTPMVFVFFRQVKTTLFPEDKEKTNQPQGPPAKTNQPQGPSSKPESPAKPPVPPVAPMDKDQSNGQKEEPVKNNDAKYIPTDIQNQRATVRAVALQVIDVMQKWVLPLLYGMLGAMVFVVRTLSMQARDRLFRNEALVALSLRVYLGMISGLAIGWFWTSSAPATSAAGAVSITTLSPFALAFVAGYGVELFFSLLDKIVSAFSK